MADLPGKELARELIERGRAESRSTPLSAVIGAVRNGGFEADKVHRLLGRLWTLERMFYYIYGGWGQGLEMNDFPPSVKYLFSKQIVDESTHEMLYLDAQLKKASSRPKRTPSAILTAISRSNSGLAYYVFSLRNLATYPHSIRIAALNLGPKILELGWMEELAEALDDPEVKGVFTSQFVENRSHINMGRRIVEEFVGKPVDTELCRWACGVAKRDYNRFLGELAAFVLGQEAPAPPAPRRQVTD